MSLPEAYVTVLHNEGIFALHGGDATLYAWGNWVCTEMGQGYTPTQIANTAYTLASPGTIHMNYAGSQFFVGASVAALCPYYMPQPAQQPTQPQPAYPSLAEKPNAEIAHRSSRTTSIGNLLSGR